MAIDKDELLRKRVAARDVEIEGVGTVKVRALTRAEMHAMRADADEVSVGEMERRMIAAGMVEPALTVEDVQTWQENSPANELGPVLDEIGRLSGLNKGAAKEAMARFRE